MGIAGDDIGHDVVCVLLRDPESVRELLAHSVQCDGSAVEVDKTVQALFTRVHPDFTSDVSIEPQVVPADHLWNFLGMTLVGLGATLLGGCPLRQLILTGEGNTDSGITVLGLFAGAAFSQNFLLASSPAGTGTWGPLAVIIGLVFCVAVGFLMREKIA